MDENNKNNSPNGWIDRELNGRLKNNSPNGWTGRELNEQLENSSLNGLADGELHFFEPSCAPQNFENKRFPLNACLLSRLLQIGKVQTKAETVEQNVRLQGSSTTRLCSELPGCTVRLKEG